MSTGRSFSTSPFRDHWTLDPNIVFLNHGSYGACPIPVLTAQSEIRTAMEREPLRFKLREWEPLLDSAREQFAAFLGSPPQSLAFLMNSTTGVNTVLRSLRLGASDEILITNQEYPACRNVVHAISEDTGATIVTAEVPYPIADSQQVVDAIAIAITSRTKIVLIDHVVSQTSIINPIEQIAKLLKEKGVELLVDGSHAPGMFPLNLRGLGATFYVGNCHKWLCAPKGTGFIYVDENRRSSIRPLVIGHGATADHTKRGRFWCEFDWQGTHDPSGYLSIPAALSFLDSLIPGGHAELMQRNHALALAGASLVEAALGTTRTVPESMLGSMVSVVLPKKLRGLEPLVLHDILFDQYSIEVQCIPAHDSPESILRISAHAYNSIEQYTYLAESLSDLMNRREGVTP